MSSVLSSASQLYPTPCITGAEAVCAIGSSLAECLENWQAGRSGLCEYQGMLQGRIADRRLMAGRRYSAAANLAVHVAHRAATRAGWGSAELRDTWIFAASSRGNAGELLGHQAWRRPSPRFSASNTIHSEIAAAVSIELGIHGPWQMLASGCSAGLDALGMAWMALRAGACRRALVLAVELPLVPEIIAAFRATHLMSKDLRNDPLHPATSGLHLGEGAAALTLELEAGAVLAEVESYRANSDAFHPLIIPQDGGALAELISHFPHPALICPHATGTPNHAQAEPNALRTVFGEKLPPQLLMKPLTGHTLGACGLLDVSLIAGTLPSVPGNLPGLTGVPSGKITLSPGDSILKIASAMGGHNAALSLRMPHQR